MPKPKESTALQAGRLSLVQAPIWCDYSVLFSFSPILAHWKHHLEKLYISFQGISFSISCRTIRNSVAPRHEFWGPKSMEIYRWRFKDLNKFWILVRTFVSVKPIFCMILLSKYHEELLDKSYSSSIRSLCLNLSLNLKFSFLD